MPRIIFLKNLYKKHDAFDLKGKLEKKLYGKIIDIFEYTEKISVNEMDPYGEEQWDDDPSWEKIDKLYLICRDVELKAVLLKPGENIVAARIETRTCKSGVVDLRDDSLIIYDKDVEPENKNQ